MSQEYPGGPGVRTQGFHCCGLGSVPGQGTKTSQAGFKKKKKSYHFTLLLKILQWFLISIRVNSKLLTMTHKPPQNLASTQTICSRNVPGRVTVGTRDWSTSMSCWLCFTFRLPPTSPPHPIPVSSWPLCSSQPGPLSFFKHARLISVLGICTCHSFFLRYFSAKSAHDYFLLMDQVLA